MAEKSPKFPLLSHVRAFFLGNSESLPPTKEQAAMPAKMADEWCEAGKSFWNDKEWEKAYSCFMKACESDGKHGESLYSHLCNQFLFAAKLISETVAKVAIQAAFVSCTVNQLMK